MSTVHFKKIKVRNFFSIADEVEIDFDAMAGMNYIYGFNYDLNINNGSGKSVIFTEAILFALFNKTLKDVSKSHIPHRTRKKDCCVMLRFIAHGKEYEVLNSVAPTHYKLFEVKDDGSLEDITKSSINETVQHMEKNVLRSSFSMVCNSMILSIQGMRTLFSMSKGDRRAFVEQATGLSVIGLINKQCREQKNKLDRERSNLTIELNTVTKHIEDLERKNVEFDADRKASLQRLAIEYKKLAPTEMEAPGDADGITQRIEDNQEKLRKLKVAAVKLESERKVLQMKRKNRDDLMATYRSLIDIMCIECRSKSIDVLSIPEDEISRDYKALIDPITAKLKTISESQNAISNAIRSLESQRIIQREEMKKYERVLQENAAIESKKSSIMEQILELKDKENPFVHMIEENVCHRSDLTNQIQVLSEQLAHWEFLVFLSSENGVRSALVKKFVDVLNERVMKYLSIMNTEYSIEFDENFDWKFLTVAGECEYENFSSGEKMRINIACIFAFRDLMFTQGTFKSNILVCDEIMDASIDTFAITNLLGTLKSIGQASSVFVISHRECVSPQEFARIIFVSKRNGKSIIEKTESV